MRNSGPPSAAGRASRMTLSAQAKVTAAGRPRATSMAKLGPERTAAGTPGSSSATTVLSNAPLRCSIPLAQMMAAAPTGQAARAWASTARRCCAGTARSTASAPAMASRGVRVVRISGSSGTPGRKTGFSWSRAIAAATSASRTCNTTSRPARRATTASAVPQAPAPRMAMRPMAAIRMCPAAGLVDSFASRRGGVKGGGAPWARGVPPTT